MTFFEGMADGDSPSAPSDTADQPRVAPEKPTHQVLTIRQVYDLIARPTEPHELRDLDLAALHQLYEEGLYEKWGRQLLEETPMGPEQLVIQVASELGIRLTLIGPNRIPLSLASTAFHPDFHYIHLPSEGELTAQEIAALQKVGYESGELLLIPIVAPPAGPLVYLLFHKFPGDEWPLHRLLLETLSKIYAAHRNRCAQLNGAYDTLRATRASLAKGIAELRGEVISFERKLKRHNAAMREARAGLSTTGDKIQELEEMIAQLKITAAGSKSKHRRPRKLEREITAAHKALKSLKGHLQQLRNRIDDALTPGVSCSASFGIIS